MGKGLVWRGVLGLACLLVPTVRGQRGVKKRKKLAEFVEERKRGGCQVIVLGDMNARVGNEELLGVIGKYGVPGRNVSGERLLEMCSEM